MHSGTVQIVAHHLMVLDVTTYISASHCI